MKFKLLFFGLLALATPVTSFAETVHDGASSALKNAVILIIRHAEEPEQGDRLSSAGDARAKAYVPYFKTFTIGGQPLKLDYLFAAKDPPLVVAHASHSNRLPTHWAFELTPDSKTNTF